MVNPAAVGYCNLQGTCLSQSVSIQHVIGALLGIICLGVILIYLMFAFGLSFRSWRNYRRVRKHQRETIIMPKGGRL